MRVIIIGGGAAGLIAGIESARNKASVIILERNNSCGKKLLLTGNGKCNYLNEDLDNKHFYSQNRDVLEQILTAKNKDEVINFWHDLKIISKHKNGYLYPNSNQSSTILNALLLASQKLNIKINTNTYVTHVNQKSKGFLIKTNKGDYDCDKVIVTCGGKTFPKTGSDGNGYVIAQSFNHQVVNIHPGLVQLIMKENYLSTWAGIREDCSLKLYLNKKFIKEEKGEIQLTNYGISGICVMNLSSFILNNQQMEIKINFLPMFKDEESLKTFLAQNKQDNLYNVLAKCLNSKLVKVILKQAAIDENSFWNHISSSKQNELITFLMSFNCEIKGTRDFTEAQISVGGVSLSEINPITLESKIVPNLYFAGEILDVNGDCGGYNLTFAWLSGILVGKSIGESCNESSSRV